MTVNLSYRPVSRFPLGITTVWSCRCQCGTAIGVYIAGQGADASGGI